MTRIRISAPVDSTDRFTQQIRSLQEQVAELQRSFPRLSRRGSYTPTLGAHIVIGTGGSAGNTATYAYAGGVLVAEGAITLGTSGASIGASAHTISLPTGFTAAQATQYRNVGRCRLTPAGAGYIGEVVINSATTLLITIEQIVGSYPSLQAIGASVPAVWAAGNQIIWSATVSGTFA